MNREISAPDDNSLELEYELDEAPQKVWRAISIPAFRENWLPKDALADPDGAVVVPGEEVCYRLRETEAPFLESTVTFRIAPIGSGGTRLRIVHELPNVRGGRVTRTAANSNDTLMLAA
ncbi:hypothetical protein MYG64_18710 [Ensifer adhaerens]|uniref:SRPBCC family protein n=1 Tax=Ensifer adhaerens TaxID=106592 RepID=UPI0021007A2F|nr:hypothetical protein [Ensifer adhaerens]UTV36538.1 hypothetical protein MYG64_18710 [Ensifer adhaerens]